MFSSFTSRVLFSLFSLFLVRNGVSSQIPNLYTDPVVYNDFVVGEQSRIGEGIIEFTNSFDGEEMNEENIRASYQRLLNRIAASITALENLGAYDGNTRMRDAALGLFQFYDRTARSQYSELLELMLKEEFTTEDEARYYELVDSITADEALYDGKFQEAQSEFAKKYNITLVDKEE